MMKQFLAICAIIAAGFASAISTSWTADTTGRIDSDGSFTANQAAFKTSFAVACVFNVTDIEAFVADTSSVLIGATCAGANGTGPSFFMKADGTIGGKVKSSVTTDYSTSVTTGDGSYRGSYGKLDYKSLLVEGQNNAALNVSLSGELNGSGITVTYDLYINGVKVLTAVHDNMTNTAGFGQVVVDGEAYYMEGNIATAEDIASLPVVPASSPAVPEPTALALLALGVAGLALRRKA